MAALSAFFSNTKAPITPPTIFFTTVSISEYDFTVKTFILSTCLIDRFFMKLEFCSHAYDFQLFPTQALIFLHAVGSSLVVVPCTVKTAWLNVVSEDNL